VQNPIHLGARSEPQPDLALLHPRTDFYVDAHPEPDDVLLVIEVAETSQDSDRAVKIPLYAKAGIPVVWLVDLEGEGVQAHTKPSPHGYGEIRQLWRGQVVTLETFPDLQISVTIFSAKTFVRFQSNKNRVVVLLRDERGDRGDSPRKRERKKGKFGANPTLSRNCELADSE